MKLSVFLLCATLLGLPVVTRADPLVIADFEGGTNGLEGPIKRDDTVAKEGKASGKIEAQLADVTQRAWITIKKPLDLRNPVKSVSLWVKSAEARQITVQVVDSTGQTLQVRPKLTPGKEWQKITVDSFESGPGWQAYGGANDKKVHWPLGFLNILIEKNGLEGGNGTVWIDQIVAETEGVAKSVTPTLEESSVGAQKVMLADFDDNTGGFNGPIVLEKDAGKIGGAGKIEAKLADVERGAWVTTTKNLDLKNEIKGLSFWVKSKEAKQITVRLVDQTGQTFQLRPALNGSGEWQQIALASFESGAGFQSYGGAGDKRVHWPAKSLSFIIEKNGLEGGNGTVLLDNVEAYVNAEKLVGKLDLGQGKPGNTFFLTEPVRLPVETQGDTIVWKASDFWGKTVGEGTETVANKVAVIAPKVERTGYYEVELTALKDGATLAAGKTSFVVTTPLDLSKIQSSPFGLMTHFAQNWPLDVIPVLAKGGVKNIRDEQYWMHIEKKKGEFEFPDNFTAYMNALKAAHIDPLIVLDFGSRIYDDTPDAPGYGNAPYTDEGRAAYARYGQEILKKYGAQIKAVEVWNEYNGTFGKGPVAQDKAKFYAEMLQVTYPALKKTRPDVNVVGVSAVAVPLPYFEDLFKRGSLKYMDSLSLHPYRTQSLPEGVEQQLLKLQSLIKKYNDGQPMPLWITELGWYVKTRDSRSDVIVTETDQAKYLVRANVLALSAGVVQYYWYHAHDDASFPTSGVLRGTDDPMGRYTPKPAFAAYAVMQRNLLDAQFQKREETVNEDTYSMLFKDGANQKRVMWSLQPQTVAVKAGGPLQIVDIMGNAQTLNPTGGEVKLALSDAPIYVSGAITGLPPADNSFGKSIASAEEDFSEKQGNEGWSYGFYVAPETGGAYDMAKWQPFPRYNTSIWGYTWVGDQKYLELSPAGGHPGMQDKKPVWAVRRYVSPVAGNLRLRGNISRPEKGDGITARIFADGKEIWSKKIAGKEISSAKYDVNVPVKVGSVLDFAIDPNASIDYDGTSFGIKITQMP